MVRTATSSGVRFLAPPATCGDELDRVEWAGTIAVHLRDDLYAGVRCTSRPLLLALQAMLGERAVADAPAPALYSVRLGASTRRSAAPVHHLHEGGRVVLGTRDVHRLVRGLAHHLHGQLPREASRHVVEAVPVAAPRGVLLVPQELLSMPRPVDRLLTSAGYLLADVPRVFLDARRAEVVVPEPSLRMDLSLLPPELAAASPREAVLEPGSYPLAGWLLRVGPDRAGPLPPLEAAALAAHLLPPPYPDGAQAAVEDILRTVCTVPTSGVTWSTSDELVRAVVAAGQV